MTAAVASRSELFRKGAEHYLDALVALEAFAREVQRICAGVYQTHAAELAAEMGLDPAEGESYSEREPADRWAAVGISRPAQKDCHFYLYLWWEEDDSGAASIQAYLSLYVYSKGLRDTIHEQFRTANLKCRIVKYDAYQLALSSLIQPHKLDSAGEVLDDLVLEWLAYCKSIGGLKLNK
jgi:hypothetical protein